MIVGAIIIFFAALILSWLMAITIIQLSKSGCFIAAIEPHSLHSHQVATGGGWAIIGSGLVAYGLWLNIGSATTNYSMILLIGAGLALAVISWLDDQKSVAFQWRLICHALAVGILLAWLPDELLLFQGAVPLIWDRLFLFLAWTWFINLYNFMDGTDGMNGVESIALGLGLAVALCLLADNGYPFDITGSDTPTLIMWNLALGGAAAGFLIPNWAPAKIFCGDVGSIVLGYWFGWSLVILALNGAWAAALIAPMYYWGDASLTLFLRIVRREKFWLSSHVHSYHIAVNRHSVSHARVACIVAVLNMILISLAWLSILWPVMAWGTLVIAFILVSILLIYFHKPAL